jgi:hypothetical protein
MKLRISGPLLSAKKRIGSRVRGFWPVQGQPSPRKIDFKYRLVAKFLIGSLEMYSVISGSFFGSN